MSDTQPSGVTLIALERQRQIDKEGYSAEHDADINQNNQLCDAAICYAIASHFNLDADTVQCWIADFWPPWDEFKPSEDPIRNLVKAGALIAAEIDRLQRLDPVTAAVRAESEDNERKAFIAGWDVAHTDYGMINSHIAYRMYRKSKAEATTDAPGEPNAT